MTPADRRCPVCKALKKWLRERYKVAQQNVIANNAGPWSDRAQALGRLCALDDVLREMRRLSRPTRRAKRHGR